ncbi:Serine/threonine-protein kinase [Serendipita sp. 401]|nr:Serine/threonine-protein kinase [Serendipita sp. 401]
MAQPAANGTPGELETTTRPGGILDHESAPYVIKNEIGKGSFATVYRGFHRDSRAAVAIKTVSRSILTPKLIDNLESEINILKQLKHPHITELIEIVKSERFIFLIMEDCTGGDLSGYIKRRGRVESLRYIPEPGAAPIYYPHPRTGGLDIVAVRSFLRQMGRALKFLRQRNLIHRDIKPQNLLLKPATPADHEKGHPLGIPILKIADFGFARHLPNTMLAETLCGSPLYMAPEILRYEKYGSQADLWSVGAVLYEISVGKPPFRAQNHIELLKRIEQARSTVKFPDEEEGSTLTPVPPDIKKLIRALLKRHPVERVTFEEFFVSKAMANSKFHAPKSIEDGNYVGSPSSYSPKSIGTMTPLTNGNSKLPPPVMIPHIPENHRIIPPEVLDPQALVEVIVKWADELFELVKAIPEKPLPDPEKFVLKEGESPRHGTRRRNAQVDAELAAVNCISLYMLVMTFAQNGVDRLRDFMDTVELDDEPSIVSVGFDEAVDWFGACYEKCSQGAQTVRTWLPEGGMNEPTSYMDQVLFDRALTLV